MLRKIFIITLLISAVSVGLYVYSGFSLKNALADQKGVVQHIRNAEAGVNLQQECSQLRLPFTARVYSLFGITSFILTLVSLGLYVFGVFKRNQHNLSKNFLFISSLLLVALIVFILIQNISEPEFPMLACLLNL